MRPCIQRVRIECVLRRRVPRFPAREPQEIRGAEDQRLAVVRDNAGQKSANEERRGKHVWHV